MIINYKKLNTLSAGQVLFRPGVNEYKDLTSGKLESLKKEFPKVRATFEDGDLEIVGGGDQSFFEDENGQQQPSSSFVSLSGMKDKEAINLVKQSGDKQLLDRWLEETRSPNVEKAIRDQLRAIEKAGEK